MTDQQTIVTNLNLADGRPVLEIVIRADLGLLSKETDSALVISFQAATPRGLTSDSMEESPSQEEVEGEGSRRILRLVPGASLSSTQSVSIPKPRRNTAKLSRRELEVLRLVANGCANREIAKELVITLATVERHVSNIYTKIGARGRVDAVKYAFRKNHVDTSLTPEVPGAVPRAAAGRP